MPWDAGSIIGKLELNNDGFLHSMLEARGIAELFPGVVQEFMANPLLGFIDITKEAGEAIGEMFAGVEDDALDLKIAAEKAGTSMSFFSEWAGVASTVKVSTEQLGNAFKFLQITADEATQGGKGTEKLVEAYERIHISTEFLKEHANDAEGLFLAIKHGVDSLPQGEQTDVLRQILGRGGADLIPVMRMTTEEANRLIQTQQEMGDVAEESEGKAAQAYKDLTVSIHQAWEGIEKSVMEPVAKYVEEHSQEITAVIAHVSGQIRDDIAGVFDYLNSDIGKDMLHGVLSDLEAIIKDIPFVMTEVGHGIEFITNAVRTVADMTGEALGAAKEFAGFLGIGDSPTPKSQSPATPGNPTSAARPTTQWDWIPSQPFTIHPTMPPPPPAESSHDWGSEFHAPDSGPAAPDLAPPPTLPTAGSAGQSLAPGIPVKPWQNPLADGSPQASAATIHNYHVGNLTVQVGDSNGMSPEELGRLIHGKVQGVLSAAKSADQWGVVHDNVAEGTGGNA